MSKTTHDLKESNAYLGYQKRAIDEHAIVSITDPKGVITDINGKFCDTYDYKREKVLGKTQNIICSDHHPPLFYQKMWSTVKRGNTWNGKINNISQNGKNIWLNLTIVPFLDSTGYAYQYVSIGTDITARKEAEAHIEFQTYYNTYSGLLNIKMLIDCLEQAIRLCQSQLRSTFLY